MIKTFNPNLLSLVAVVFIAVMGGQGPAWADGEVHEKKELSLSEGSKHKAGENTDAVALTRCPEPRPQMCTREYRPVCAKLQDQWR